MSLSSSTHGVVCFTLLNELSHHSTATEPMPGGRLGHCPFCDAVCPSASSASSLTPLGGRARERFGKPTLPHAEREDVQTHFAEISLLGKQEIDALGSQATEQSMLEMMQQQVTNDDQNHHVTCSYPTSMTWRKTLATGRDKNRIR